MPSSTATAGDENELTTRPAAAAAAAAAAPLYAPKLAMSMLIFDEDMLMLTGEDGDVFDEFCRFFKKLLY